VSQKRVNFETVQLEILQIDFDDIWQKYSQYARIAFVCFSFRVGLCYYIIFETQCIIILYQILKHLKIIV